MRWSRRRRRNWPQLRTLKEGDIVWLERYSESEPILLVQRVRRKEVFPCRTVYWHDGVFLSLTTGKLHTKKLGNAMTYGRVERAPSPQESA